MADLTPLRLIGAQTPTNQYAGALEAQLREFSPRLLASDTWGRALIQEIFKIPDDRLAQMRMMTSDEPRSAVIDFTPLPHLLRLEIKAYFAANLNDARSWCKDWIYRRRDVLRWLCEEWSQFSAQFDITCVADLPHPLTSLANGRWSDKVRENSEPLMAAYRDWFSRVRGWKTTQEQTYVSNGEFVTKTYYHGNIAVVGAVHLWTIINRERITKPLEMRDAILLDDLFSEDDTRYKDRQRIRDQWIQFYKYPEWMRPAVRAFLLDKVDHGEFAPSTARGFIVTSFRDFLYDRFENPSPKCLSASLIEDDFLAWGNDKKLAGKNWWTDAARMIEFAGRKWPDQWPALSISDRATRKIKRRQAVEFGGRLHASREGGGRSTPKMVVDRLAMVIGELPAPIPALFCIGVATGARSEDLHAFLYDCLGDDPSDPDFMLLHYWQNKTSSWNQKPLLKSDPVHQQLIGVIEAQRTAIKRRHGHTTKYLFPVFYGAKEVFLDQNYSMHEIKKLCIEHEICGPDGKIYNFTWHPLRHHRGTEMALAGYDTLSIMFELGHSSPEMAMTYINHRLELRKKALATKGGGRFVDIQGRVDETVVQLLQRKSDARYATRVCGGACTVPEQIGEWCEHAHACLSCKYFRADSNDIEYFRGEKTQLLGLIEQQQETFGSVESPGSQSVKIGFRRQQRNLKTLANLNTIIATLEAGGSYAGSTRRYRPVKEDTDE